MKAAVLFLALVARPLAAQVAAPPAPAPAPPAAAVPLPAWSPAAACCADLVAEVRAMLRDSMAEHGVPGAQIAVLREGRVVWSEGIGFADLEQGVAATPATRFRAGSVSKSLTSAAVGLLVERGRLDLDAEVQRYVPDFPRKRWPITVRQAAGHLAGIRHYRGEEFAIRDRYPTVTSALAIFRDDSLLAEPGTRYLYSSYGWNLVSAVVEAAAGRPFLSVMIEEVFRPLGMTRTGADHTDSLVAGRARWYTVPDGGGGILNAPYVDNSLKWAGGGFLTTAEDLVRFGDAIATGQLIRRETAESLWSPMRLSDGRATGYGIGWVVRRDPAGRRWVGHSGGSMGGTAYLVVYPEARLAVALLANSDQRLVGLAPGIAARFRDLAGP